MRDAGPRIQGSVHRQPPKFARIDLNDASRLPATIPGRVIGEAEDVVVGGWLRDVGNRDLASMFRPIPFGDVVFWSDDCKIWRRYCRTSANMWGHAATLDHIRAVNSVSDTGDSPEQRLVYYMQTVSAGKLCFQDIEFRPIRDLLRLSR